jgi:hypothetical protein
VAAGFAVRPEPFDLASLAAVALALFFDAAFTAGT